MSETKNELNDIILNKSGGDFGGFKKVLLAVATFAVLLIIVVVIMSSFGDKKSDLAKNIPEQDQTKVIPPEPEIVPDQQNSLFKPAIISEDNTTIEPDALELNEVPTFEAPKEEPKESVISDPYDAVETKEITIKPVTTKTTSSNTAKSTPKTAKDTVINKHYVQVGSFEKSPDKTLLKKIEALGYSYALKRVDVRGKMVTKLLIGPYDSYRDALKEKATIAQKIESSAFIYKAQ